MNQRVLNSQINFDSVDQKIKPDQKNGKKLIATILIIYEEKKNIQKCESQYLIEPNMWL